MGAQVQLGGHPTDLGTTGGAKALLSPVTPAPAPAGTGRGPGWVLSSSWAATWAQRTCAQVWLLRLDKDTALCSGHHPHLSQQLQTRAGRKGVETHASAEEPDTALKAHSPGPKAARFPE